MSGRDVLMVRADDETVAGLQQPGVERTVMRGRPMSGWLDVDTAVTAEDAVGDLVVRAVGYARTLPSTSTPG